VPESPQPLFGLPAEQQDPRAPGFRFLAAVLWTLGYPDQALDRAATAVALARASADVSRLIPAQVYLARIHQFRRDARRTREAAEVVRGLAREHGFAQRLAAATILSGWAQVADGDAAGIEAISDGLAAFRATGAGDDVPHWLALRAEARGAAGDVEGGLRDLAEAQALVEAGGSRVWEPEVHRLRGELLIRADARGARGRPTGAEAEACFLRALAVSRGQRARSLELRAATSLARLWIADGRLSDARGVLAGVHGWFSEGFETVDLGEASALLAAAAPGDARARGSRSAPAPGRRGAAGKSRRRRVTTRNP
jgi:adenylate cyclase